jgi:hypothetical protein
VRGAARTRKWREVERRPLDWASRSLQREFEVVIMAEVLIGEMVWVEPSDHERAVVVDAKGCPVSAAIAVGPAPTTSTS